MHEFTVHFQTLTPIWTGGAQANSDRVEETGIIGSLRWWYEGIVRGMGGRAVDPTQHPDQFDGDKYAQARGRGLRGANLLAKAGLCPASQLFGATGWQRRFRLRVTGLASQPLFFMASDNVYQAAGNWLWRIFDSGKLGGTRTGRGPGMQFTFGAQALWSEEGALHFVVRERDVVPRLAYLLDTVARYGAIGAKTQHGFGQIALLDLDQGLVAEGRTLVRRDAAATQGLMVICCGWIVFFRVCMNWRLLTHTKRRPSQSDGPRASYIAHSFHAPLTSATRANKRIPLLAWGAISACVLGFAPVGPMRRSTLCLGAAMPNATANAAPGASG